MRSEIIEVLPLGAFIIDRNHQVVQWNGVIEEWSRVKREQIEGRRLGDTFKRFNEPRYCRFIDDCFDQGAAPVFLSPALHKGLLPTFKPDGSPRTQIITLSPFREGRTSVKGLVTVQDITDLTQAQRALETERKLLNAVFDVMPHSIYVKDKDLCILKANRAFLNFHGAREKDILGKFIDDLKGNTPSEKVEIKRTSKQVVETCQPVNRYGVESTF